MKRKLCMAMFLVLAALKAASQQYAPEWESLDQRETPAWWKDAKFGIFIHWGPYAVPAYAPVDEVEGVYEKYAEHYENRLLQKNELFLKHHTRHFGENFTYQDFAPMFKAEHFNPDKWAELFRKSGAKYVVLTSKHHDGFCLWPSAQSPRWNSVAIGPHRDLAGELTEAVRKQGLRMGFYYSLLEWSHPLYTEATLDQWVDQHMLPQMKDLVTRYRPEVIFSDGEWDYTSDKLKSEAFLAWLYNESPVKETVVANDRWGSETRSKHGDYYTTEYNLVHNQEGIGAAAAHPWEESRGIGTSYGYNRFETTDHYYTSKQLVDLLIEKVSNGGNLLLNIGPKADGLIPVIMQERLLDIGEWLQVNGEAIYGTSAWEKRPHESNGQTIFYTLKGDDVYVICTKWPEKPFTIKGIGKGGRVRMLGTEVKVKAAYRNNTLTITPPAIHPGNMPCNYAWVFKVEHGR
ncbi:alpha-L-fucosidase [Pontibacter sp. SGAir0037]|uniref:alpha-L-fucosidase n=1 Tax=Pontibacter sp. SGAir0037 TaxID=2571030 RepID=UPI0010CCFFD0|nr:alpha-L-fucosidase [Pontibacter sp. SGAir0037]QCR24942.1 alpha-L-fucosidase [Pontibacter sp. SGAir0037]